MDVISTQMDKSNSQMILIFTRYYFVKFNSVNLNDGRLSFFGLQIFENLSELLKCVIISIR